MSPLFQAILASVEALGWEFRRVPDCEVIEARFEAHHTHVPIHAQVFPEISVLHVVATSAHEFQSRQIPKLCELVMRTTNQLALGSWELDWERGKALFRVSQILPPEFGVPKSILDGMVHTAVAEMDRLTPALAEISRLDAAGLALLDVRELMAREDWLPPLAQED